MTPKVTTNILTLLAGLALSIVAMGAEPAGKKNVLIFFIDDLRTELGCYGTDYIKSPHIDKFASQGVLFERAYCQQALCAPSRISMMAGQYPDSTGIYDLFTPLRKKIPDVMTMPRYFKEHGYVTASYGKVYHHHSDDRANWSDLPDAPGNIYADPELLASIKLRTETAEKKGLTGLALWAESRGPATEAVEVSDDEYRDGAVARQAIESLRQHHDRPFFMCVGFAKPHLPFAAPKRYWDLYEREQFSVPNRELPAGAPKLAFTVWGELRGYSDIPSTGGLDDEKTRELKHGYAACVSYMDAQVGKVLAELDRLGLRENTIVVLWGDHGYKLGDYGLWCKHTNLELDTRVPLIISAPGLERGKHSKALVEIVDLFPTLARLTGGEAPESCDGQSLETLMHDPGQAFRPYALSQYPRGKVMGYSLRTDRWRYTEWINSETKAIVAQELYDQGETPVPTQNLAGDPAYRQQVATLAQQLNASKRVKQFQAKAGE
jgi:iduronate 2-sulfatase